MAQDCASPHELDEIKNHYTYLRKLWYNPNDHECRTNTDKLEQLNKKVAVIKNSIYNLTER
jgi:hypothetical protein